jgi:hypothetical protein
VTTPECRMCVALQAEPMGGRSYCAEHAADAVRAWNAFAYDNSENPRRRGRLFNIDWGTHQFWKANAGNAKARRRWRRRNVPNTQKMAHAADVIWRERVGPLRRVPPVDMAPASHDLVDAMRYMTEALRGAP